MDFCCDEYLEKYDFSKEEQNLKQQILQQKQQKKPKIKIK